MGFFLNFFFVLAFQRYKIMNEEEYVKNMQSPGHLKKYLVYVVTVIDIMKVIVCKSISSGLACGLTFLVCQLPNNMASQEKGLSNSLTK